MKLNTLDAGSLNVSDVVFAEDYREGLVHQVVKAYVARSHTGTHANKSRAQVRGGGRKPWRQKGTGRARRGTLRSPLARGGGVIFASSPNFSKNQHKVNRQMYRGAMRSLLSQLARDDRLVVAKDFTSKPKTSEAMKLLKKYGLSEHRNGMRVLAVVAEHDENLDMAMRNLPHVEVCTAAQLDP